MRHRKKTVKLGRKSAHKEALLSSLAVGLIMHGRITTTTAKTKAVRSVAEKLVTLAKRQDIHARRQAASILVDEVAVKKLFAEVGPQFDGRNGGYTRIIHLNRRRGDAAPMAIIELVS